MQHSRGRSALVFCSTRKGAQEAAHCLSQTVGSLGYSNPFMKSMQQYERLREFSAQKKSSCNLASCMELVFIMVVFAQRIGVLLRGFS
uniref:Uncharacterized protein n=1 Tax=Avena sativa TaxID=4498 RepID=A0ACD6AL28_AVESA